MQNHDIDTETVAYYIHEAERMRADALNELLCVWAAQAKRSAVSMARAAHAISRRGRFSLSVLTPHH